MKTWRHITHGFWGSFLIGCLALVISYALLDMTLLNESVAKRWLANSGAYESLRGQLLDSAKQQSSGIVSAPLTGDDVAAALDAAITEQVVQRKAESVVDIVYDWLHGGRRTIEFSVSFTERTDAFYDTLEQRLADALGRLPTCTNLQELANVEAGQLTCLPPQVSAGQLAEKSIDPLRSNGYAFATPITEKAFNFPQEQAVQLANLPTYVRYLQLLAIAALVSFLVASAYLLIKRRSSGLIIIGTSSLLAGAEFIVFRYILKFAADHYTPPDDNTQAVILKAFSDASSGDMSRIVLTLCLPIAVSGLLLVVAGFMWRSLSRPALTADPEPDPTPEAGDDSGQKPLT